MKQFKILVILFITIQSSAQKIEGSYRYQSKEMTFEFEIKNDSTYVSKYCGKTLDCGYSNSKKTEKIGTISRRGKFYCLREYDSVAKKNVELIVKFRNSKMIFYGYKSKGSKLEKAFEMKKASI